MRRVVASIIVAIGVSIVSGLGSSGGSSTVRAAESPWAESEVVVQSEVLSAIPSDQSRDCHVPLTPVEVHGRPTQQHACLFGGTQGVRMARFGSLYAVSLGRESEFISLRSPCNTSVWCYYSQPHDTLMIRYQTGSDWGLRFIQQASQKLIKHTGSEVYYTIDEPIKYTLEQSGAPMRIAATTISPSGEWALAELPGRGFARISFKTLEARRVVAPSAQYGYGIDPRYELAITDDGSVIAIAGRNVGLSMYGVDNLCGEPADENTGSEFSPYTYQCPRRALQSSLFRDLDAGYAPRFIAHDTALELSIEYNRDSGKVATRAVVTPASRAHTLSGAYNAFGDSFTSGEGELSDQFYASGTNTDTNKCHLSRRSYPYLVGAMWGWPTTSFACSGARIDDVLQRQRVDALAVAPSPSWVTVGIGGNDVGLMGKLKSCLGLGDCEWVDAARRGATVEEIRALFPKLVDMLHEVQSTFPQAQVSLVGYPRVVNAAPSARSQCSLTIRTLLTDSERQYLDESIVYLNQVIKAAAYYTHMQYFDIEQAFIGQRLCDATESTMNGVRFGDDIAPVSALPKLTVIGAESFHPTPYGHELTSGFIVGAQSDFFDAPPCSTCLFSEQLLTPGEYWSGVAPSDKPLKQRAGNFMTDTIREVGHMFQFSFPAGTFKPLSLVRLELHSTPQTLGEFTATEDGALTGYAAIQSGESGYHSLHAFGVLPSDESIDIYQPLALHGDDSDTTQDSSTPPVAYTTEPPSSGSGTPPVIAVVPTLSPVKTPSLLQTSLEEQPIPQIGVLASSPVSPMQPSTSTPAPVVAAMSTLRSSTSQNTSSTPAVLGATKTPAVITPNWKTNISRIRDSIGVLIITCGILLGVWCAWWGWVAWRRKKTGDTSRE